MRDLSFIRHAREREFAAAFFEHDEWEYQPGPYHLSVGGTYRPDFKDNRRGCLIEVVGTRQAFNNNRYKYEFFMKEYDIRLEFRKHTGEIIETGTGNLRLSQPRDYSVISPVRSNTWDLRFLIDELKHFFLSTRWMFKDVKEAFGIDPQKISCTLQGYNPFCSVEYYDSVKAMLKLFADHPENFPAKDYLHCLPEKIVSRGICNPNPLRFSFGMPFTLPTPAQPDETAHAQGAA